MSRSPYLKDVVPVLMVRDVKKATQFYVDKLDFTLTFQDDPKTPRYAGLRRDGVSLHLQWHAAEEWTSSTDHPTYRFPVADVDGLHAEFQARQIGTPMGAVQDTAWGTREFHLFDLDRNGLQFYRDLDRRPTDPQPLK